MVRAAQGGAVLAELLYARGTHRQLMQAHEEDSSEEEAEEEEEDEEEEEEEREEEKDKPRVKRA